MTRRQGVVILAALLFWEEYARSKLVEANIGFVGCIKARVVWAAWVCQAVFV